jgi:hypothetical protein
MSRPRGAAAAQDWSMVCARLLAYVGPCLTTPGRSFRCRRQSRCRRQCIVKGDNPKRGHHFQDCLGPYACPAASRIKFAMMSGCEIRETWLAFTSIDGRGQGKCRFCAAVSGCAFGPEVQHHRHRQPAVATSSQAGRLQLSDHLSVDRRPAVLQHVLLLT